MKEINLTQKKKTIIDDCDSEAVTQHQWYAQKTKNNFYATASIKDSVGTRRVYLHRFLLQPPKGYTVIHKDGNGLNNRRDNLEICKLGQAPRRTSKSPQNPYRGVHFVESTYCYKAVITVDGQSTYLGSFLTAEDAAHARDEEAFRQWGADARLNFPENFTARKAARPSRLDCEINRTRTALRKEVK